jgi:hypothetical protein
MKVLQATTERLFIEGKKESLYTSVNSVLEQVRFYKGEILNVTFVPVIKKISGTNTQAQVQDEPSVMIIISGTISKDKKIHWIKDWKKKKVLEEACRWVAQEIKKSLELHHIEITFQVLKMEEIE